MYFSPPNPSSPQGYETDSGLLVKLRAISLMSFGEFPDLGKIGKRIGKRLRDVLTPPMDHGPSKEERLAQRLRDSLKGLVYFDNFDEIADWKAEDVDSVQQANTPLLERPAQQVYDQDGPTSRVLLCHDYSGLLPPFCECFVAHG